MEKIFGKTLYELEDAIVTLYGLVNEDTLLTDEEHEAVNVAINSVLRIKHMFVHCPEALEYTVYREKKGGDKA